MPEERSTNEKDLLTTHEAAEIFHINDKAFRRLMDHLDIRPLRIGTQLIRWDREVVELVKALVKKQPHLAGKQDGPISE